MAGAAGEQALVARRDGAERDVLANLLWSARRRPPRSPRRACWAPDVRRAKVELDAAGGGDWHRFLRPLGGDDAPVTSGWWRSEPGWVLTIAGGPNLQPPSRLSAPS